MRDDDKKTAHDMLDQLLAQLPPNFHAAGVLFVAATGSTDSTIFAVKGAVQVPDGSEPDDVEMREQVCSCIGYAVREYVNQNWAPDEAGAPSVVLVEGGNLQ